MLVGLFRSNRPAVLLLLLILVPSLFLPWVWERPWAAVNAMPLQAALLEITGNVKWLPAVLSMVWVIIISLILTAVVNNSDLVQRRTYLPALFFPLLLAAASTTFPLEPALMGMPLVLLSLRRTWTMNNMNSALGALFDAGFLLGIAALFYLPYAFLIVVLWASVAVIRPFIWRDYVVPVLGIVATFYMSWAVLELMGVDHWRPFLTVIDRMAASATFVRPQRVLLYFLVGGFLIFGVLNHAKDYRKGIMREKNLRAAFLSYTAATLVLVLLIWTITRNYPTVVLVVPVAVFCGYAVQHAKRSWIGELGVLALMVLAIWGMWF